jgi:hypothetical protein
MKEESVFWLGGKPGGAKQSRTEPAAEQLAPAIRGACEALGLQVDDFVAALGSHGSWLVQITRDGEPHRVIWNGKDRLLSLDRALPRGGWEQIQACTVATQDAPGFISGLQHLLDPSAKTAT